MAFWWLARGSYCRAISRPSTDVEKSRWLELKSTPNLAIFGANCGAGNGGPITISIISEDVENTCQPFIPIFKCNRPDQ
jgi:hypothetical protein